MSDKLVIEGELSWVADYDVYGYRLNDDWLDNFIDGEFASKQIDPGKWDEAKGYGKFRITIERLTESE